jgi:hypothetical protein
MISRKTGFKDFAFSKIMDYKLTAEIAGCAVVGTYVLWNGFTYWGMSFIIKDERKKRFKGVLYDILDDEDYRKKYDEKFPLIMKLGGVGMNFARKAGQRYEARKSKK